MDTHSTPTGHNPATHSHSCTYLCTCTAVQSPHMHTHEHQTHTRTDKPEPRLEHTSMRADASTYAGRGYTVHGLRCCCHDLSVGQDSGQDSGQDIDLMCALVVYLAAVVVVFAEQRQGSLIVHRLSQGESGPLHCLRHANNCLRS